MIVELVNRLIDALRDELQQYGEMLARMDEQQELVIRRVASDLLDNVARVQEQGSVIVRTRSAREAVQASLASHLGLPSDATLSRITGQLPEDYRPLFTALVEENNALLIRVQQRARQNHLLLSRSLELMQSFIHSLVPSVGTPVYGQSGAIFAPAIASRPIFEVVG